MNKEVENPKILVRLGIQPQVRVNRTSHVTSQHKWHDVTIVLTTATTREFHTPPLENKQSNQNERCHK